MAGDVNKLVDEIKKSRVLPRVCIETGTYCGVSTRKFCEVFDVVLSVEYSMPLFMDAANSDIPAQFLLGDSGAVLKWLCPLVSEPCLFYLDAHWSPKSPGSADGNLLPLWEELEAISERPQPDIVVVDDVHSFGTCEPCAEWMDVTFESLYEALGRRPRVAKAYYIADWAVFFRSER